MTDETASDACLCSFGERHTRRQEWEVCVCSLRDAGLENWYVQRLFCAGRVRSGRADARPRIMQSVLKFGHAEMEDAHATVLELEEGENVASNGFFAVYDGHGGELRWEFLFLLG